LTQNEAILRHIEGSVDLPRIRGHLLGKLTSEEGIGWPLPRP
jgi:hypothetical protein